MPAAKDPTKSLKEHAASLPDVIVGESCNQASYKVGKKAFLYTGHGAKGIGFKAMFKLSASLSEAQVLAEVEPERFEAESGNWVIARFSAEKPLPKKIWSRWLKESYEEATQGETGKKKSVRRKSSGKS